MSISTSSTSHELILYGEFTRLRRLFKLVLHPADPGCMIPNVICEGKLYLQEEDRELTRTGMYPIIVAHQSHWDI